MTINMGVKPARMSFTLTDDGDFYSVLRTRDGSNFPVTAVLQIRIYNAADSLLTTWTATVSGANATFNVDKAAVATLLALSPVQGRLFYHDGASGPEIILAKGPVNDESD